MNSVTSLTTSPEATVEHVFLAGRPPLGEFLGFVTSQSVDHTRSDLAALNAAWGDANDRVRTLEQLEQGYADAESVGDVPDELTHLAAAVLETPIVRRQYGIVPFGIRMLDLDRVVVYQKHIDLAHTRALRETLGESPTLEQVFKMCLPLDGDRPDPPVNGTLAQQQPNMSQFVLGSPSNDVRVLDTQLVDASAVKGLEFGGMPSKLIVVPIGYTVNFLSAFRVNGRLLLNNGSHRAYALREAGFTHVPALIQDVTRRDELEVIANQEVVARFDDYFSAPRPPLLKDYFDERLRVVVRVPKKYRQITVVVQQGQLDVPSV